MKASGSRRKRVIAVLPPPSDFGTDSMTRRMVSRTHELVIRSRRLLRKTAYWKRAPRNDKST